MVRGNLKEKARRNTAECMIKEVNIDKEHARVACEDKERNKRVSQLVLTHPFIEKMYKYLFNLHSSNGINFFSLNDKELTITENLLGR